MIKTTRSVVLVLLCFLGGWQTVQAQVPDIKIPKLYYGQQIRTLVVIHSNIRRGNTDRILAKKTGDNNTLQWENRVTTPIAARHLWFVVHDYLKDAFALVNAENNYWLYAPTPPDNYMGTLTIESAMLTSDGNDIAPADGSCYFNFYMPSFSAYVGGMAGGVANTPRVYNLGPNATDSSTVDYSNPATLKLHALRTRSEHIVMGPLLLATDAQGPLRSYKGASPPASATESCFRFERYSYPEGFSPFVPVPFQPSVYHKAETHTLSAGNQVTRLCRTTATASTNPVAKGTILSFHAQVLRRDADSLLKLDFKGAKNAFVGWLSYEKTSYAQATVQNNIGNLPVKPRFGVGITGNYLYVIHDGLMDTITTATAFKKSQPLYVSLRNGQMHISQQLNGSWSNRAFADVALGSILSTGLGSRAGLTASVDTQDTVLVAYKPGNWLFTTDGTGTEGAFIYSTNPDLPMTADPAASLSNRFDWRTKTYRLRYKNGGTVVTENVRSPFFANYPEFVGISAKYTPANEHMGGEDNSPYSGWELIKADLGYANDGTLRPEVDLRTEPYMILYNRYQGTLRVFVYLNNMSIANNYKITLSATNLGIQGPNGNYKPPFLWSSYLQGKALDDENLTAPDYYKAQQLNSSSSGRFYYTDFQVSYDPCVSFFESAIQVKVDKVTQGTMQIVGRSLGGSIPGSTAINDWMSRNGNFLTGALNMPYGDLSQTMGDLTMNNYKQWGMSDVKNYAQFTLPGKKVEPWEREEARLKLMGESTKALGTSIVASGTALSAAGELASVYKFFGFETGAPIKAAGKFMEATGKFTEASGTAMSARSLRIRYENLRDQPDKNIRVAMPDPQPSLVFSDLALQGTLSIQSPVFSNVYITTPGSKNATVAPEFRSGSGAKGDFPMYNEPLGLFGALTTPSVGLAVLGNNALVCLKEYPVVACNARALGVIQRVAAVQISVSTLDNEGVARLNKMTRSYVLTDAPGQLETEDRLPARFNITDLIDWQTINASIQANGGAGLTNAQYAAKLQDWVKVDLQISYAQFAGKSPDGNHEGSMQSVSFPAYKSIVAAQSSTVSSVDAMATSAFPTYTLSNNPLFGDRHMFDGNEDAMQTVMNTYCTSHQVNQIRTTGGLAKMAQSEEPESEKAESVTEKDRISLYPNPTKDAVTVSYTARRKGAIAIELSDMNGRVLVKHNDSAAEDHEPKEAVVQMGTLPGGVYVLRIVFSDRSSYVQKVIRQ